MKATLFFRSAMLAMLLCATCFATRAMANTTNDDNEDDPYKEFVSPQWGLKCPEGYIRMTEYKELAKTDATARKQLDKLTSLMNKYKAKRQKMMKSAYKKITTRHPDVEAKAQKYANRLFIGWLPL